jgi:3-keto-5-aminohexanoate cleavage enzyme
MFRACGHAGAGITSTGRGANMNGNVNWERVREGVERERKRMIWRPYGMPAVGDPARSAFTDEAITSTWDVPGSVAVTVAITGAFFTREQNPSQPLTTREIYEEARKCVLAGASNIHIHVRDDRGYNVLSAARFREVIVPLRDEFPDVVVDGCLVPALAGEWEQMQEVLAEKLLDGVPINTTATYIGDALFAKPIPIVLEKTRLVIEAGAQPIIACYVDGDISNADRWLFKTGLLSQGAQWLILPALPGCSPMNNSRQMLEGLLRLTSGIREVDPAATITVCAAGRATFYLVVAATMLGLNIRVGLEDTIWKWPHREDLLQSNVENFRDAKQMAELLGRTVATPAEYRKMAGLVRQQIS